MKRHSHPRPARATRSLKIERCESRQLLAADGLALTNDFVDTDQSSAPILLDVLANDSFDSDYAGDRRITALSTGSLGGRIEITADGQRIEYAAPAGRSGLEVFQYTVDDRLSATVSVNIVSPLADVDVFVDQFQDEYQFDLISQASFPDDYLGGKRITLVSETARGSEIEISADGQSVVYRTDNNLAGKDSFTYIVDDLFTAAVTINVSNPLASDVFERLQNSGSTELPVLANDFQLRSPHSYEGVVSETQWATIRDAAQITHVLDHAGDEVTISADGRSLLFTPADDQFGGRYFRYVVDGRWEQSVRVLVQRPVVNDFVVADVDGGTHTFDVLLNDDYWSALTRERIRLVQRVTGVTQGDQGGTVEIAPNGKSVLYTPATGFVGTERFEYVADENYPATVSVNVTQPVRDDRFTVTMNSTHSLDVLQNDFASDEGHHHAITSVTESVLGATVEVDRNGRVSYTPPDDLEIDGYHSDSFRYTVNDLYSATVAVSVRSPVASDHYQFDANVPRELRVLENDHFGSSYLGAAIITSVSLPSDGGIATIGVGGQTIRYQPGRLGESFTYTVDARFTQTVTTSTIPRLRPDSVTADQNGVAVLVDVLANDFPSYPNTTFGPYQGRRALSADSFSEHGGVVTVTADGRISYVPPTDFVGRDTVNYRVDDFHTQTITLNVIRRASDDRVSVSPGSQENRLNVLANDIHGADYSGAGLITEVTSSSAGAQVKISEDRRSIVYTPATGFTGEDSFVYSIDGRSQATVIVSVSDTGQPPLERFDSTLEFRDFILEQAIQQYQYQFGTQDYHSYPFQTEYRYFERAASFPGTADSPQFSETNVQVAGVDEHDIVETDGFFIYTLRGSELTIVNALPADDLRIVSRTEITGNPVGMYLSGDRVTVISENTRDFDYPTWDYPRDSFADSSDRSQSFYPGPPQPSSTLVTVLDVTDRTSPEMVSETKFDGRFKDSRRIDNQVFLVLQSDTVLPELISTCNEEDVCLFESEAEYRQRIHQDFASIMETTLPGYESFDGDGALVRGGPLLMPEDILRATDDVTTITIVASIDMTSSEPGLSAVSGVMADASTKIFASATSLYVFNDSVEPIENERWTGILKFDWNGETGAIDFAATGQVPGRLLNQFSADELDGQLRLTTEISNSFTGNHSGNPESAVFVLEDDGGVLEFVGSMQNLAVGQNIKSVRYFGDRVFVTTFDSVDPLTAIDLSDPSRPRALGHVPIPGFSSYMQFVSPDRLLTIGTNTATGFGGRAMVSLFDVSDLTSPQLIDQHNLPKFSTSQANNDHHAFGWFANHELLSVPTDRYFSQRYDADGDGYKEASRSVREDELSILHVGVDENGVEGIQARGRVVHDAEVQRSVAINDHIYSVGLDGVRAVQVNDANTVVDEALFDWELPIDDQPWLPIDYAEIGTSARDLLAQRGIHRGELLLVTQERHEGEVEVVLRSGDEHFRIRGTSAADLALIDETFRFSDNLQFNADDPFDVNKDGSVTTLDALIVINDMNNHRVGALAVDQVLRQVASRFQRYTDTNADGHVTAVDALRVINELVRRDQASEPILFRFDEVDREDETDRDDDRSEQESLLF